MKKVKLPRTSATSHCRGWFGLCLLPLTLVGISAANAAETITYSYDAKGRLATVTHTGSRNAGVQTTYTHDKADNRKNVKTTGAPS